MCCFSVSLCQMSGGSEDQKSKGATATSTSSSSSSSPTLAVVPTRADIPLDQAIALAKRCAATIVLGENSSAVPNRFEEAALEQIRAMEYAAQLCLVTRRLNAESTSWGVVCISWGENKWTLPSDEHGHYINITVSSKLVPQLSPVVQRGKVRIFPARGDIQRLQAEIKTAMAAVRTAAKAVIDMRISASLQPKVEHKFERDSMQFHDGLCDSAIVVHGWEPVGSLVPASSVPTPGPARKPTDRKWVVEAYCALLKARKAYPESERGSLHHADWFPYPESMFENVFDKNICGDLDYDFPWPSITTEISIESEEMRLKRTLVPFNQLVEGQRILYGVYNWGERSLQIEVERDKAYPNTRVVWMLMLSETGDPLSAVCRDHFL